MTATSQHVSGGRDTAGDAAHDADLPLASQDVSYSFVITDRPH